MTGEFIKGNAVKSTSSSEPAVTKKVAFVIAGQSNSVGWVAFDNGENEANVLQYSQSNEVVLAEPHLDHRNGSTNNMGFNVQFAIEYMKQNPNHELCFIPCGEGGTGIAGTGNWGVGDTLFEACVDRTNQFFIDNPEFELGGILWHQGEFDTNNSNSANNYQSGLDEQIEAFRDQITEADDKTPVVVGPLNPFWVGSNEDRLTVNNALKNIDDRLSYVYCIDDTALNSPASAGTGTDAIHFDAPSLRLMGKRYFNGVYYANQNVPIPAAVPDTPSDFTVVPGNEQIDLSWTIPRSNRSPITNYEYSLDESEFVAFDPAVTGSSATITGLTNGEEYSVKIRAVNGVGSSEPTDSASATLDLIRLPEGALLQITFDSGSPVDLTGNVNTMDLQAGASIASDPERGNVLRISGYARLDLGPDFSIGQRSFTKSIWGRKTSFTSNANLWSGDGSAGGLDRSNHVFWVRNRLLTSVTNVAGVVDNPTFSLDDSHLNRWVMYSITYDRPTGLTVLYVDGQEVARANVPANGNFDSLDHIGNYATGTNSWKGDLDDPIFYDRALTAEEVNNLYVMTNAQ